MARQRDLNRTRERIMAAAQKEFAASGLAGARTDAIACRARVNERMIFYCFGSKGDSTGPYSSKSCRRKRASSNRPPTWTSPRA